MYLNNNILKYTMNHYIKPPWYIKDKKKIPPILSVAPMTPPRPTTGRVGFTAGLAAVFVAPRIEISVLGLQQAVLASYQA